MTINPHPSLELCRICGGDLLVSFDSVILGDIPVTYAICKVCRSLLLIKPTWLERSYTTKFDPDPDSGAGLRARMVVSVISELTRRGWIQQGIKTLDYGAGRGLLLDRMNNSGFDAWGYDPYPHSEFLGNRVSSTLTGDKFKLITCIEVLEHTLDPLDTLKALRNTLEPGGIILLSTEFYDEFRHDVDWWYLVPEHGQHVTIFSKTGFDICVNKSGLSWRGTVSLADTPFLHILTSGQTHISNKEIDEITLIVHNKIRPMLFFFRLINIFKLILRPTKVFQKLITRIHKLNRR